MRSQTLVSCLYDLERRERIGRRPIEFYHRHAELTLGLDAPLVIYVDPEQAEWVRSSRRSRGLLELTRVVERPLEALDLHPMLPSIARCRTFANDDPIKGTPLHQIVEWSKFGLVEEVINDNPFGTEYFAWIDLGVGHIARAPISFPAPTERVAVLQMCAVAPQEVEDKLAFLGYERGRIAAGFFRGHRDALRQLVDAFRRELASVLAQGFRPNEQMILSYLSVTRPDLFEFYYGDYSSILANWDYVRRDLATVFLNLVHSRRMALWDTANRICEHVEASVAQGALTMTADERARLLDEHYIAAWYVGRPDVAHLVRREFQGELTVTDYFAEHRNRIQGNFALLPAFDPAVERSSHAGVSDTPSVSVVIPVYNGEATLERAVNSVLRQTCGDLEVILVDDCSTDGSLDLARRLAAADPRVRLVARTRRAGSPATPRDDGVAMAKGRHIALLDQDDYWLPEKLAAQLPLFESGHVALVYSDAYIVSNGGSPGIPRGPVTVRRGDLPEGDVSAALLREDCVPALTAVIRREWLDRVGRFDRHNLVGVDDYYYWLRISLSGGRFAAVKQPTAVHVSRPDSLGHTRQQECAHSLTQMWAALAQEFPRLRYASPGSPHSS